jgi:ArsR family transcriptional regulator
MPKTPAQSLRSRPPQSRRQPTPPRPPASGKGEVADVCEVLCINQEKVSRARRVLPASAVLTTLADTLRALGDPTRLQIVIALVAEELCVCDLALLVGVSESAVSHSLRTLRQLRLVRYRKVGKIAYYTLDDPHVAQLVTEGIRHVARGA